MNGSKISWFDKEQARASHERASMRYFQARWRPMSQIKNCLQLFEKQEESGPSLARQQSRSESNRKFVGGFEKQGFWTTT